MSSLARDRRAHTCGVVLSERLRLRFDAVRCRREYASAGSAMRAASRSSLSGFRRTDDKVIERGFASVGAPLHEAQDERFASQVSPRLKTQLGRLIGTPEYLPPEAGRCDAAPSLDVFSLGTTLYRLCTQPLPRMTGLRSIHEVAVDEEARRGIGGVCGPLSWQRT